MGRRHYRKKPDEEGVLDVVVTASRQSPAFGFVATVVMLIVAAALYGNPNSLPQGFTRLFGFVFFLLAGLIALATVIGIITRLASGVANPTARKPRETNQRFNPFRSRRERFTNIEATVKRWQEAPPPQPRPRVHVDPPRAAQPAAAKPSAPAASLLSKGELAFYLPLCDVVAGRFVVQVKPSLVDVLQARNDPRFARMAALHVDFLLCDPATLQPRLVIELDDRSHRRRGRSAADRWKEQLLNEKGIPLIRQWCLPAYDVAALRAAIDRAIII